MNPYDNWTTKTPDQIEAEVVRYFTLLGEIKDEPSNVAVEAIAMFRQILSKNGYVFYQP